MLQNLKNGATRQIGGVPRESYTTHPLFADKMIHELNREEVVFPAADIPDNFKSWLLMALSDIPFPNLRMATGTYWKLIHKAPDELTFGTLQKAVDIIWNSKPDTWKPEFKGELVSTNQSILQDHYEKMLAINKMRMACDAIIAPIREKVIDELIEITKEEKERAAAAGKIIKPR